MTRLQPDRVRRAHAAAHGPERRDVARHPGGAAPEVRGEGDAVDRHLHGRRLDLGQRARHGPSRRLRRPDGALDARHAARRVDSQRQPRPRMPGSSTSSSAATACSASSSTSISRSCAQRRLPVRSARPSTTAQFVPVLTSRLLPDHGVGLMYGAPVDGAAVAAGRDAALHLSRGRGAGRAIPPLGDVSQVKLRRLVFNLSKQGPLAMRLKWFAEKHIEPLLESCTVSAQPRRWGRGRRASSRATIRCTTRCRICGTTCRTRPTSCTSTSFRATSSCRSSTACATIVRAERANLLNASVRVVHREDNALTYAPADRHAGGGALPESVDRRAGHGADGDADAAPDRPVSASQGAGSSCRIRSHYTREQLERSYPEIRAFLAARAEFDPDGLLTTTFLERLQSLLS